jgi:integration host factor subunit alpha
LFWCDFKKRGELMTLTKTGIIENAFKGLKIDKQKGKSLVKMFFEEMSSLLEQGKQIRLSGFGNFNLRDKKERPGRNPKSGMAAVIMARRVVTFRAGVKLKARVEKYEGADNKRSIIRSNRKK